MAYELPPRTLFGSNGPDPSEYSVVRTEIQSGGSDRDELGRAYQDRRNDQGGKATDTHLLQFSAGVYCPNLFDPLLIDAVNHVVQVDGRAHVIRYDPELLAD